MVSFDCFLIVEKVVLFLIEKLNDYFGYYFCIVNLF